LRISLPFSGNVIFVPFFHPGLISIVRISSTFVGFLHKNMEHIIKKQDIKTMNLPIPWS